MLNFIDKKNNQKIDEKFAYIIILLYLYYLIIKRLTMKKDIKIARLEEQLAEAKKQAKEAKAEARKAMRELSKERKKKTPGP